MADVAIVAPGVSAAPLSYAIPGLQEIIVKTLSASFDGTAAAVSWKPAITLIAPTGREVGTYPLDTTLAAGASADVCWFPGVANLIPIPQVGEVRLVYDFTVTGAAKATIDTSTDGTLAGAFPTDLNYLEVFLTGRTDKPGIAPFVVPDNVLFTFNGDTGANYNRVFLASSVGGAVAQGQAVSANNIAGVLASSSAAASFSGLCRLFLPNYNGTTFFKIAEFTAWALDSTAATSHYQIGLESAEWANTAAVSSLQTTPEQAGGKFVIGTRLTIWGR
jgi:hypothetical protein